MQSGKDDGGGGGQGHVLLAFERGGQVGRGERERMLKKKMERRRRRREGEWACLKSLGAWFPGGLSSGNPGTDWDRAG